MLTQYYGLDWLAFLLLCISMYFIGKKKRWAFKLDILACILYTIVSIMMGSPVFICTNIVMGVLTYKAWKDWK